MQITYANFGFVFFFVVQFLRFFSEIQKDNRGLSFNTISSIGPNGAVIHYAAEEATALPLSRNLYVVDSGGQYL